MWYTLQHKVSSWTLVGKDMSETEATQWMWKWFYTYINLILTKAAELSMHEVVGNAEWDRLGGFQSTASWLRPFRLDFIQFGGLGIINYIIIYINNNNLKTLKQILMLFSSFFFFWLTAWEFDTGFQFEVNKISYLNVHYAINVSTLKNGSLSILDWMS